MNNEPISLIFLAYNEANTIENEIQSFYENIVSKIPGSEFIIAEDGSTDGTTEILRRLALEKGIIHLNGEERKGYSKALIDAVKSAKNDYIFFSDTGLKHNPSDFWKLYERRKEFDLIVGKKTKREDQIYRRILTYFYNLYLRITFKVDKVYDADSGFRLFNRSVVNEVFSNNLSFKSFVGSEVVLRTVFKGLRYCEVPVSYYKREGVSRGVPFKSIPKQIKRVLGDLGRLKKELNVKN